MGMPFKILKYSDEKVSISCENVISLWNILKYLVETPYLRSYYIENYDGGNTLVPKELWKEENISFKEVRKNVFLFPYNSINFIIEDSIHNIDVYVVSETTRSFKSSCELQFSIKDTENFYAVLNVNKLSTLMTLYFFSLLKLGYNNKMFESFDSLWKKGEIFKIKEVEYLSSSFQIGVKGFYFIVKFVKDSNEVEYYKISYGNGKFKKEILKDEKGFNPGLLKKKIFSKARIFSIIYYSLIPLIIILFLVFKRKWLILFLLVYMFLRLFYSLLKKNLYKIFK